MEHGPVHEVPVALSGRFVQLLLTIAAPYVSTIEQFVLWVIVCSMALGVGIPVSFSFMLDFVPVRDRGYVAAIVAGLSFSSRPSIQSSGKSTSSVSS